jgi:hypothetical protein
VRIPVLAAAALLAAALATAALSPAASASPANSPGGTWSGYLATGSTFTSVAAAFQLPTSLTCNSAADELDPWVGFDGNGAGPIEQVGLRVTCAGLVPVVHPWWDMNPNPPVYWTDPVSLGDLIHASVTRSGPNYTMTLTDNSKGWTESTTQMWSTVKHVSAEVILESPPDEFPNFHTIFFTGATLNGAPLGNAHPTGLYANTAAYVQATPSAISSGTNFSIGFNHE